MKASILPPAGQSFFELGNTRNKRRSRAALAALAVAALSTTASATVNIYEPFNYSTSPLQGNTNTSAGTAANGLSWLQAGVSNPPAGINVTSGSLTGPVALPPSIGNGLSITHQATGDGASNRLALNQSYTTGTVYYSFLLNVTSLANTNTTTGGFFFSLNNTGNSSQTGNPSVQPGKVQVRADPTDSSKYNLGIFGQGSATATSNAWAGTLLDPNTTHFIVGSVNAGAGTKEAKLWIDPDPGTFGLSSAPTFTAHDTDQTTWTGNNLASVLVRQTGLLPAGINMDELRVGSTWSDVTPTLQSYWDINGATGGAGGATPSGTWDGATSNWSASSLGDVPTTVWPGAGYKAVFSAGSDATGAYTVTVSGTQTASALSFKDGTVALTGGTVNLASGAIESASANTTTISSAITGTAGLTKLGTSGTVVLTGSLTYTGATTISAGTLQIGNGTTAGALPVGSTITNNGTLVFNRSDTVTQGTDFSGAGMSGTGNLTQAGSGNLILNVPNTHTGITKATAGTLTVTHSLGLQNSTVDTTGAGSIVFDNALTSATVGGLEGATAYTANSAMSITVGNNVRNAAYSAAITGTGSFTKVGSMAQELSGVNTYSGGTNVNAGVLQFLATNTMPSTGAVAVNSSGTLGVRVTSTVGDWSNATSGIGSLGGLIAGDGGQTASQVTWNDGSSLGVHTGGTNVTYSGNIGLFNGVSDATKSVGLMKRGQGALTLTGTNTFRGQLQVANDGGTVVLPTALANAGQSMPVPTVSIGNAGGDNTILDGSRDAGVKILVNDALPTNSVINFGSSVAGTDTPSSLLQLYDGFVTVGNLPGASFNQTVRGITGNSGRVKTGLGTLTVNVPTGESYASTSTMRTDYQDASVHGRVIKTGPGREDWNQANGNFNGDFILQQGTAGVGTANVFGVGSSLTNRLILNGGTLMNVTGAALTINVKRVEFGGSFTVDPNPTINTNMQFQDATFTLTTPNPTITVLPGAGGQFIAWGKITESSAGYGFTKAGAGTLNLTASGIAGANNYSGATTIQEGALRVIEFSQIGTGASPLNLSGGTLEYNGTGGTNARLFNVTNPTHVTANSSIIYNSTTANLTDVTDPNGIVFEFSNNTIDQSGGTLTLLHQATSQGITFRPRFSGNGFNYTGPVVISNGAGTRKTVMESTNATGTQTWSGDITGTGSYSRGTGGNTVFAGQLFSVGGVSVANTSNIQVAHSAGFDRVVRTPALTIGTTSSQLDLTNNKLITSSAVGSWNGSAYTGITGLVATGRSGNTWSGNGIVTSESSAVGSNFTSLGVAKASDVRPATATATGLWAGQTITGTDTLVMYTYGGDANLDGKINVDDYIKIDSGIAAGLTGWVNGDFNYDGKVNIDDYTTVIDANIGNQTGVIPTASGLESIGGVTAVPEPAALTLVLALGLPLRGRRRRAR